MITEEKEGGGKWGGRTTKGREERMKRKGRKKCKVATYLKGFSLCQDLFMYFSENPLNNQVKY